MKVHVLVIVPLVLVAGCALEETGDSTGSPEVTELEFAASTYSEGITGGIDRATWEGGADGHVRIQGWVCAPPHPNKLEVNVALYTLSDNGVHNTYRGAAQQAANLPAASDADYQGIKAACGADGNHRFNFVVNPDGEIASGESLRVNGKVHGLGELGYCSWLSCDYGFHTLYVQRP